MKVIRGNIWNIPQNWHKFSRETHLVWFIEGAMASWHNLAGSRCQKLSEVGVRAPATLASQPGSRTRFVKDWPRDQTLLIKHLRFASQAKCLTVWSRPKTLLVQRFLFASRKKKFEFFHTLRHKFCIFCLSKNVFWRGQKVKHSLQRKLLDQQCLIVWPGP